ncbi:MAG: type VII toxin-antitoxin system MntA family adenylyltransferase antitoxin [Candidatus Anammoxibacter sp.]
MNIKTITEKLQIYFTERDDISLVFLFGSWANSWECADSDIDIAIYFKPEEKVMEWESSNFRSDAEHAIWLDVERIIGKEIDLLVLNRATPTIAEAALRGIPILIKDHNLYLDFLLRITFEAIDFRQWTEDYWKHKELMKNGIAARK